MQNPSTLRGVYAQYLIAFANILHLGFKALYKFLPLKINEGRVRVVGEAVGDIGWDGFLRLDMREPEFRVLSEIYHRVGDSRVVVVLGLAAGIVDFQLGPGGAPRFWNTLLQTVSRREFKLGSLNDVREAVFDFLK